VATFLPLQVHSHCTGQRKAHNGGNAVGGPMLEYWFKEYMALTNTAGDFLGAGNANGQTN